MSSNFIGGKKKIKKRRTERESCLPKKCTSLILYFKLGLDIQWPIKRHGQQMKDEGDNEKEKECRVKEEGKKQRKERRE